MSKICPECHKEYESGKFCLECGAKLVDAKVALYCPNCQIIVPSGKFCPECGTKLIEKTVVEGGEPSAPSKPATPPVSETICPACGFPNDGSSSICAACGYPLKEETPSPSKPAESNKETAVGIDPESILSKYRDEEGDLRHLNDEEWEKAFEEISAVASTGNPEAQYFLASFYCFSGKMPNDFDKAYDLLRSAEKAGIKRAGAVLGLFYAYGISVKQDIKEAIKRLQGVKEIPGARAALGSIYLGFTGEIDKARECFEYAASKEDGDGYCGLGMMYKEGIGVPQDYSKAYEFFNLAAAHGTAEAEYELGTMYYDGIGTQVDYDQAKYWFTEAANHGFAKGFNGLAQMYIDGKGADKDEEQSAVLFKKAADIGNTYAMLQLGYYYSSILKDPNKAFSWFSKAADNGEPAAMYELSQCYKNGLGTATDEKQAEVFLKKAMEAGYLPDVEPNGAPVVPFEVKLDNVVKDLTRKPKDYDDKLYLPVKNEELGVKLVFRCNINDVPFDKLLCRMFICSHFSQEKVDELGSLIKKDPLAHDYSIHYPWGTVREFVHIEKFISEEQFAVFVPYSTLLNSNGEFRETMMFAFISNNEDNVPLLLCCYNLPYQIKRSGTFSHKYSFDTL